MPCQADRIHYQIKKLARRRILARGRLAAKKLVDGLVSKAAMAARGSRAGQRSVVCPPLNRRLTYAGHFRDFFGANPLVHG